MDITVYCQDTEAPPAAVDGVLVRIYSGVTLITSGTTGEGVNDPGEVILTVPSAATYVARFSMSTPGYSIVSPAELVVAADGDTFDIDVELYEHDVALDANMCRVTGFVYDTFGQPIRNRPLVFQPIAPPQTIATRRAYDVARRVSTDANGEISVDLVRALHYDVSLEEFETPREVIVPDRSWVGVADLLLPVPMSVTFDPTSVAMADGDDEIVAVTVLTSDGVTRDLSELLDFELEFLASPTSGLEVSISGDSILLSASATGSYTVTPAVTDDTKDLIKPAAGGVSGSLSVVVT